MGQVVSFKQPFHVFLIEDGHSHWYLAPTKIIALNQYARDSGEKPSEFRRKYPEITVTRLDDNQKLTITNRAEDTGEPEDEEMTKTCGEWAEEAYGDVHCIAWSDE